MDTSATLLERLRQPSQEQAWTRFVDLYTPLLFHWARRMGCQEADAADLVQEAFTLLLRKMPEFNYDSQKSFRAWLRTVSLNCWHNLQRRKGLPLESDPSLSVVPDPGNEAFWETDYRNHLVERALQLMQSEFQPATWRSCWECVVNGRPPGEVAAELGISVNAVYIARSRVLSRLREELAGLLD